MTCLLILFSIAFDVNAAILNECDEKLPFLRSSVDATVYSFDLIFVGNYAQLGMCCYWVTKRSNPDIPNLEK
ncbi:hypothetical protein F5Y09DRAFT_304212 [Xylaria sp. FL1042]|nr:hypothetical protein F5Y09DRAFT_304212 [Xylaria sp. FL1042]